ncbi:Der1-like family [Aspergillus sp. HF37]|nr:Der1-like family [Aspergillus sp. HF37]
MDAFWAAPPVTRTITALTFAVSILHISDILSGWYIFFSPSRIFKLPPEIWRPFSAFLLTGRGIGFFLDLYHMFKYGSALERDSPWFSGPDDFFVYVLFVGTVILLTAGCYLGFGVFTTPLIVAFVYSFARVNEGKKVKFIMIPLPVEFLPWAFVLMDLVTGGPPSAILDITGIIAAHTHYFLTRIYPSFGGGRNYLVTPVFVKRLFNRPRGVHRTYGTSLRPPETRESDGGWTSTLKGSWSARGRGRKLGGG